MNCERRYLYLPDTEWRVMLLVLNEMRNKLIAQGRYTDAVDEIIMKMAGYPFVPGQEHSSRAAFGTGFSIKLFRRAGTIWSLTPYRTRRDPRFRADPVLSVV